MAGRRERLEALGAAIRRGAFTPVLLSRHFWSDDVYDVPLVHAEARSEFDSMLANVSAADANRLLLLLGGVGAGKTHLLRALRSACIGRALCAYVPFDPTNARFDRHFLGKLLASLTESVGGTGSTTGMDIVAAGFQRIAPQIWNQLADLWREDGNDHATTAGLVMELADRVMERHSLPDADLNLTRALVYATASVHAVKIRAKRYISGEPLTPIDQTIVPALPPLTDPAYSIHLLSLSRIVGSVAGCPLVLFFDQAEALHKFGLDGLQRALDTIFSLLGEVPDVLAVVAWEETRYGMDAELIPQYLQDRLRSGSRCMLSNNRTTAEIRAILDVRFTNAFRLSGIEADAANPLDPLPPDFPEQHTGKTTRLLLEAASDEIRLLLDEKVSESGTPTSYIEAIDCQWSAAHDATPERLEWSDRELVDLVRWACTEASCQVSRSALGGNRTIAWCDLDLVRDQVRVFALTKNTQGGGLARQTEAALRLREKRVPIGVRLSLFPTNPGTQAVKHLVDLVACGGRRVQVLAEELHRAATYRDFVEANRAFAGFSDWASRADVLGSLRFVRSILNEEGAASTGNTRNKPPAESPVRQSGESAASGSGLGSADEISLGVTDDGEPVSILVRDLTRHAIVLGGSGSGKTTLILRLVEQVLLRRIPVILVDRKGDFASYADETSWRRLIGSAEGAERARLRTQIAVSLYTPGKLTGRPVAIPLLPPDLARLRDEERDEATRAAADALAGMISLQDTRSDRQKREVLRQAIGQTEPGRGLDGLIEVLHEAKPELIARLGLLDQKGRHRDALIPMLEHLRLSRGALFQATGEALDFAQMFDSAPGGRTRLTILSLAFLPDTGDQIFFVSRALAEARRFCRTRPSATLQALLVFDEADAYAPAVSKPSTKEPLLDLLRRARSGGLGLLLGTQSPGDLDYKGRDNIGTWALGRIQEKTAVAKVAFVAEGTGIDLTAKLPRFLDHGRFLVRRPAGGLAEVKAFRSLIEAVQIPEEKILHLSRNGIA